MKYGVAGLPIIMSRPDGLYRAPVRNLRSYFFVERLHFDHCPDRDKTVPRSDYVEEAKPIFLRLCRKDNTARSSVPSFRKQLPLLRTRHEANSDAFIGTGMNAALVTIRF